jgi:hypothetical protein
MVQHVSRVANFAAHSLAKVALSLRLEHVWMEECPPCQNSWKNISVLFHCVVYRD